MEQLIEVITIVTLAFLGYRMKKQHGKQKVRTRFLIEALMENQSQIQRLSRMDMEGSGGKQSILEPDSDGSRSKARTI